MAAPTNVLFRGIRAYFTLFTIGVSYTFLKIPKSAEISNTKIWAGVAFNAVRIRCTLRWEFCGRYQLFQYLAISWFIFYLIFLQGNCHPRRQVSNHVVIETVNSCKTTCTATVTYQAFQTRPTCPTKTLCDAISGENVGGVLINGLSRMGGASSTLLIRSWHQTNTRTRTYARYARHYHCHIRQSRLR